MALCSRTIKRFEIPGEPDDWIDLRLLSTAQIREIRQQAFADVADKPEAERNSEAGALMVERVLARCLVGWSYAEDDGSAIPVTPENLADLDPKTSMWAFEMAIGQEPESESEKG